MFEYYTRLSKALHSCGQLVLLEQLRSRGEFPIHDESSLYSHLFVNYHTQFLKLKNKKILKDDTWGKLFPTNCQTRSKDFDIKLCVFLIRNCKKFPKPIRGWNNINPPESDTSISANVLRLKELRNKYAHGKKLLWFMTKSEFEEEWKVLVSILNALGLMDTARAGNHLEMCRNTPLEAHNMSFQRNQGCANSSFILILTIIIVILLKGNSIDFYWSSHYEHQATIKLKKIYIKTFGYDLEYENVVQEFRTPFKERDLSHHRNHDLKDIASNNIVMENLPDGDEYKFIIIRATGGIGGTSIAEEIALKWAVDKSLWNNFQFVFLLKCREVINMKITSFKDILPLKYPSVFQHITYEDLYFMSNQTLIVIDDLHELMNTDNQFQRIHLLDLLDPWKNSLPNVRIIVTGHPLSVSRFIQYFRVYNRKEVELIKFSKENVHTFMGSKSGNIGGSHSFQRMLNISTDRHCLF